MLRYFPVAAPLMVIFGLLPWVTDFFWLGVPAMITFLFLQYQLTVLTRREAKSDADTHVYSPSWRPVEGVLVFIFILSCFVGLFTLFASVLLSALIPQADMEQTEAIAKGILFASSGILLVYELSLPATKLEENASR